MTEQDNRMYAADLMKRSDVAFDARDIAVLAKVLGTLEGDVSNWLNFSLNVASLRERMVNGVRAGLYRPQLDRAPVSDKPEGNLK